MAHLAIDLTKYQMFFDILHISAENFIEIKQSWPLPQLYRLPEVKFKIYTLSIKAIYNRLAYFFFFFF